MNQTYSSSDMLRRADDYSSSMIWLYDLPIWLFGALTIFVFVALTLGGLAIFHRRINQSGFASLIDNGTVGWFFSGVTVLYGLLLGLLTVATWSNFSAAGSLTSQEAASLSVLYRDLAGYPQPERSQLETKLREYTRFIIERSWPAQRRGYINDGETEKMRQFQMQFVTVEPVTEGEKLFHSEAIRAFNSVIEFRRLRADSIKGSVPSVIWYVVLVGAVFTLVFSYFFLVKDFRLHAALTGVLAAMIGLLVFLIAALDHPYWGEVSVSADAYKLVLDKVMMLVPPTPAVILKP